MARTRILLVDDQSIILDGLEALIQQEQAFEVIGRASNGREAIDKTEELKPDVVLMDISMPEVDGIEATREIRASRKLKKTDVKILVLSMYNNREYVNEMLEAGANGYVLKNTRREELRDAILTVASGNRYLADEVQRTIDETNHKRAEGDPVQFLTRREKQIVQLISKDMSNQQIADELHLSPQTIETHRKNIFHKLDLHSTAALVKYAVERGW